jgi:hypothetical protein
MVYKYFLCMTCRASGTQGTSIFSDCIHRIGTFIYLMDMVDVDIFENVGLDESIMLD